MKTIKRTKANQINYNLEDLDEQNRQIKKALKIVLYCNQRLELIVQDEEN